MGKGANFINFSAFTLNHQHWTIHSPESLREFCTGVWGAPRAFLSSHYPEILLHFIAAVLLQSTTHFGNYHHPMCRYSQVSHPCRCVGCNVVHDCKKKTKKQKQKRKGPRTHNYVENRLSVISIVFKKNCFPFTKDCLKDFSKTIGQNTFIFKPEEELQSALNFYMIWVQEFI